MQTAQRRERKQNKPSIYPYDEWRVVEDSFDVETNYRDETIFATGNGYIGYRGNFEEGYQGPVGTSLQGTYLNGFYESHPIQYGESAYGYAKNAQTMLNVTDSKIINVFVQGEQFSLFEGKLLKYQRVLDFRTGIMHREMTWESPAGNRVEIHVQRMVCLERKHLAAFSYEVTPVNFSGEITLVSALNGQVQNQVTLGDPRVGSAFHGQVLTTEDVVQDGSLAAIRQRTQNSRFTLVCAMENAIETGNQYHLEVGTKEQMASAEYTVDALEGVPVRLHKWVAYYTSKDYDEHELVQLARAEVAEARELGYDKLTAEQRDFLYEYWKHTDIQIEGDPALQQSLRFNAFHLLQSVGRDGKTNIAAKGVTGEGYEGHYFWDTETYIFPFFLYTHPDISRKLLEYRYTTLDKARMRAKELAHKGALYAWRTIDGEETSPYFPAGTAAYHINADIMYALKKYLHATNDTEFLLKYGAEMLFETARFWVDMGAYIPKHENQFCINEVTGPDEYTALVNNNLYTNVMAKDHLEFAFETARWMKENHSQVFTRLAEKLNLQDSETTDWQSAADKMYVAFDEEYGIYPQDDSFLQKEVWDFENTPEDHYPLLLHYHPLVIYRYQVLKQADVMLAMFLQGNRFTTAEKKRNYHYYEALTTHDSSLSPCIYSILSAEIGEVNQAYGYFMRTARMDLDDYNGNVKDGIHSASMAGAWLSIVQGFAGMREYGGKLMFRPVIPEQWRQYQFKVSFAGRLLRVSVTPKDTTYALESGDTLTLYHEGAPIDVSTGKPVTVSTEPKLEAVLFDLDGVITDTAEYHYLAWKQLADELKIDFDRKINERLKGVGRLDSLNIILENSTLQLSEDEKKALANRKNEYYQSLIEKITPDDVLPGILNLLKDLQERNIKIGLASASKNAVLVVEKLGIGEYLDTIVDAAALQKGKPDPEIFLTAADELHVPYRNCIGIEDARSGVESIQGAGMKAVGVGTPSAMDIADWAVQDTSELSVTKLLQWI
ncbi:beta-phosphoglucomutase [Alicyclobacillus sp. SO9]|uniref:beta-phosphoglucomutase n=1 Tax=Alicyclobacillus sp. SO9 TaxID=2665646 RepID=UPI0018E7146D|nr:beta-phosphoglucomutase [Alicyclobacillus sp. SO9]QQE76864.1 beta-phosphoglucomutase [Alicyclobacillus sp. SO9]